MSWFAKGLFREVIVALVLGGLAANLTLAANGGHPTKPASAALADRVEERFADLTSELSPEAAEAAAWAALVDFQVALYQRLFTTPFERAGEEPLRVAGPITGLGYEHSLPGFRPQTGEWLYFTPLWIGAERPYPRTRIEGVGEIVGGQVQEAIGWLESARSFEPEAVLVIIATVDLADDSRHSLLLPMMAVDEQTIASLLILSGLTSASNVYYKDDCYGGRFADDPQYQLCLQVNRLRLIRDTQTADDALDTCHSNALSFGLTTMGACGLGTLLCRGGWLLVLCVAVCVTIGVAAGLAAWSRCERQHQQALNLALQAFLLGQIECCLAACSRSPECAP